jgi:hypothetical protein
MDRITPLQTPIFEAAPGGVSSPLSSLPDTPLRDTTDDWNINHESMEEDTEEGVEEHSFNRLEDAADGGGSRGRRPRRAYNFDSKQRVLQQVVDILQQNHWTFGNLLNAWVEEYGDGRMLLLDHQGYKTVAQRQRAYSRALRLPSVQALHSDDLSTDSLAAELRALINTSSFGQFDHTTDLETLDFDLAFETLQSIAPQWHSLLTSLLQNQRAHRDSYTAISNLQGTAKRAFVVTSIICHSQAPKRSNILASIMDIYLVGSGTKRRVLETLSGLGLCHSYHTANRLMKSIAEYAKVCIFIFL